MIIPTPALLVGAASAFVGFGEDPHCRGEMVDRLARRVRARPGDPWDAALVHHAGYWSHFDHRGNVSSWPIPARCTANAVAAFAHRANIIEREPEAGDLFVLWSPSRRSFIHTGIVLEVGEPGEFPSGQAFFECVVLSPNVHPDGRVGGPCTLRMMRRVSPDRGDCFVRWTHIRPAWAPAPPTQEAA
jgi:hypothetical protein